MDQKKLTHRHINDLESDERITAHGDDVPHPGKVAVDTKKTNRDIIKQHLVRALRTNQKFKIIDPV
jgi:hypothetical protein